MGFGSAVGQALGPRVPHNRTRAIGCSRLGTNKEPMKHRLVDSLLQTWNPLVLCCGCESRALASCPGGEHREACRSASRLSPALATLSRRGLPSPRKRVVALIFLATLLHLAAERLQDGVVVEVEWPGSELDRPLLDHLLRARAPA